MRRKIEKKNAYVIHTRPVSSSPEPVNFPYGPGIEYGTRKRIKSCRNVKHERSMHTRNLFI